MTFIEYVDLYIVSVLIVLLLIFRDDRRAYTDSGKLSDVPTKEIVSSFWLSVFWPLITLIIVVFHVFKYINEFFLFIYGILLLDIDIGWNKFLFHLLDIYDSIIIFFRDYGKKAKLKRAAFQRKT